MDYYTTDHLGSVRVITDMDGEICQNPSLDVANASKSEYLYGGKELQTFFGIDWYDSGARFQTTHGTFSSLDPMSESYYPISPYAYCAGDPVNLIDPEGRDWYTNNMTGYYTWFDGNDDHEGYTYFGTKGSVLGEMEDIINSFMINTLHLESIFTENFSFEIASADKGVFSSEEAEGFFDEFRRNQGPEFSVILENNKMTQDLRDSRTAKEKDLALQNYDFLKNLKGTSQWSIFDVFTHLSLTRQFVGTYTYRGMISSGGNYVYNMVYDSKSRYSFFLHIPKPVRRNESSRFGNTYQFYLWVSPRK